MRFARIYFVKGALRDKKQQLRGQWNYCITDPPVAGTSSAFLFEDTNKILLFHPYTLQAYVVPHDATEVEHAPDIPEWEKDKPRLIELILRKWQLYKGLEMQRAYDVATKVLLELGGHAPDEEFVIMKAGQPEKPKRISGKPAEADRYKPLKDKGRRADIAASFTGPGSILEAMATFNLTRSAILSHLFCIWKDHGIGYEIQGDSAKLLFPYSQPVQEEEEEDPFS